MNDPTLPPNHPINTLPAEAFIQNSTKFEPKLTFDERCTVLAFSIAGIGKRVLAAAFGINRRTVSHMVNPQSGHYRDVRAKLAELGEEAFKRQYCTEKGSTAIRAAFSMPEVKQTMEVYDQTPHSPMPSPRAKKKAGINVVKLDHMPYSHRVEVAFTDEHGWRWRDLDSEFAEDWFVAEAEGSNLTSEACLKAMIAEQFPTP